MLVLPAPPPDLWAQIRELANRQSAVSTGDLDTAESVLSWASRPSRGLLGLELRPRPGSPPHRLSMGRSEEADVVIVESSVSRFHAGLEWNAERERGELLDLGAKNGTFLNGRRLEPAGRSVLPDDAIIGLGAVFGHFMTPSAFYGWLLRGAEPHADMGAWPMGALKL